MSINQLPEDVLSVGDRVRGIVSLIDLEAEEIEVSLTDYLREISLYSKEERLSFQRALFREKLDSLTDLDTVPTEKDVDSFPKRRYRPPMVNFERVLIVDDDEDDLSEMSEHIQERFRVQVDRARGSVEALERFRELDRYKDAQSSEDFSGFLARFRRVLGRGPEEENSERGERIASRYDLAVIDVKLGNEQGVDVARKLLNLEPRLAIIFTSDDPLAEEKVIVYGQKFPFTIKSPDAIGECIEKMISGYEEEVDHQDTTYAGKGSFIEQLAMEAFADRPIGDTLRKMLDQLRARTGASNAFVFEVDSISKSVSVVAASPTLGELVEKFILDGLYYSPVQNVVEEGELFQVAEIYNQRNYPRFKSFYPVIPFQSSIGVPLEISDMPVRHALFLFGEHIPEFTDADIEVVREASRLMRAALERSLLMDFMRRYEMRYSHGLLVGSLVHELRNKLDSLGSRIETLPAILETIANPRRRNRRLKRLKVGEEQIADIARVKEELDELVDAYSRLVRDDLKEVDVNAVTRKVEEQLAARARDTRVHISLRLDDGSVLARAVFSRVEQIIMNLMLNAIQQIGAQRERMAKLAGGRRKSALLQQGLIAVDTRCAEGEDAPIQIVVVDTGPGIHRYRWKDIFLLDTSTREEGHGLGLFISRNLAENMGGTVRLVDSVVFLGSAFLVELPRFNGNGE
jgi:signal transduction histidine kinase